MAAWSWAEALMWDWSEQEASWCLTAPQHLLFMMCFCRTVEVGQELHLFQQETAAAARRTLLLWCNLYCCCCTLITNRFNRPADCLEIKRILLHDLLVFRTSRARERWFLRSRWNDLFCADILGLFLQTHKQTEHLNSVEPETRSASSLWGFHITKTSFMASLLFGHKISSHIETIQSLFIV